MGSETFLATDLGVGSPNKRLRPRLQTPFTLAGTCAPPARPSRAVEALPVTSLALEQRLEGRHPLPVQPGREAARLVEHARLNADGSQLTVQTLELARLALPIGGFEHR